MAQSQSRQGIPTYLTLEQFKEFVLPHLHIGSRGPEPKLSLHATFNYILKLLYLGCQWKELLVKTAISSALFGIISYLMIELPYTKAMLILPQPSLIVLFRLVLSTGLTIVEFTEQWMGLDLH